MVRAPLLPFERYLAFSARESNFNGASPTKANGATLLLDPDIRRALAVGSSELLNELERSGLDDAQAQRKLLRYLIRMSTRPTPFGLFAGVALGQWGERTDLKLAAANFTRTRPDMEWLLKFIMALEARPEVRQHLRLVANTAAVVRAGRVFLTERASRGDDGVGPEVSLRATRPVLRALELARAPIPYVDLVKAVIASFPNVSPTKVEQLLTDLWEQTLLLTDLRPSLTAASPAHYVARRLADIPPAAAELAALEAILAASADCDALPPSESAKGYQQLFKRANAVPNARSNIPLMVDMAWSLDGRYIHTNVGAEAARAAELLLRLTPLPDGLPFLAGYRHAFEAKYGPSREVPVLEVLDPNFGLGSPAHYNGGPGIPRHRSASRADTLLDLAVTAIRERQRVAELDADTLARLETWTPVHTQAPPSLDIYAFVAAHSAAALDAGEFQIIVGPNLGAMAAGRNLGRFADVLAPAADLALQQVAEAEERHDPGRIWAELVYLPRTSHTANVIIRPAVRQYEIVIGVSPSVPSDKVIPVDELVLGVRNGRFYVRWPTQDAEVVVCAGHMLNTNNAPALVRFLSEVSRDGVAQLYSFDWGPAAGLPFRPRVQVGRIVLAPAEWRIDTLTRTRDLPADSSTRFRAVVSYWRAQWNVPRFVALTVGDNRLLLDLTDDQQLEELRTEVRRLPDGGALLLQEALPAPDQVWLPGPGGHFVTELVVSLRLKAPMPEERAAENATSKALLPKLLPTTVAQRHRPPGSEWLFAKLYCPRTLEEDLIAGPMLDFAEEMLATGLAQEWFFIRYADPDPHIRLRFRGAPDVLIGQLMPRVCAWGAELMSAGACLRFCFDTYERELERYGGDEGTTAAESIFAADSRATAHLLRLIRERTLQFDRMTLSLLTVDGLLAGLGMDEHDRLQWYRRNASLWHEMGSVYRRQKVLFRSVIGDPEWLPGQPGGKAVAQIVETRRAVLASMAGRLAQFEQQGALSQPMATLYYSYVHLHCNRLLGTDGTTEGQILSLLARTRQGLERASTVSRGSHDEGRL